MSDQRVTNPFDINIKRAVISTNRQGLYITDIRASIIELSLYESLDKLSIAGDLTLLDDANLYSQIDFLGTEVLSIEFELPNSPFSSFQRSFIITGVMETTKANDNAEVIRLSLVDTDGYVDVLTNVNKAYDGTIEQIINKILKDNFETPRTLLVNPDETSRQNEMRVLIPNLRPYTAIQWIADRATSDLGLPFFAFSTLLDRNIRFLSLESLLDQAPANNQPYRYNQAAANNSDQDLLAQAHVIVSYQQKNHEETLKIANRGGISGKYQFLDTNNFALSGIDYRVDKIYDLLASKLSGLESPNYDPFFEVHRGKLHEYGTTQVSQISASAVYSDVPSYHEEIDAAGHSTKAISYSVGQFLRKSEMSVMLPGRNWYPNSMGYHAIGSTIEMEFMDNSTKADAAEAADTTPDYKRSGKYLVHSTRHMFRNNAGKVRYETINNVVKLSSRSR